MRDLASKVDLVEGGAALLISKFSGVKIDGKEGAQPLRDLASKVDVVEGGTALSTSKTSIYWGEKLFEAGFLF